jgi:peptidoglycan/LPS O-acetylase OafA/YrhL
LPRLLLGGTAGVAVFFALSGFLITTLLLERRDRTGTPGFGAFYLRRARRLLPALAVFLAVVGLASLWWPWLASPRSLFASVFYVQNFQIIHHGGGAALSHLWSLSVEEQFYLLWPVVLMLAVRRSIRTGLLAAVALLAWSLGDRLWLFGHAPDGLRLYFGSDMNACLLAAGCVVAFAARAGWSLPRSFYWPLLAAVGVAGTVFQLQVVSVTFVPVFAAGAAALVILASVGDRAPASPGWLNLVGRRSYALYLWHFPLMVVVPDHLAVTHLVTVPIGVALAWAATCLSWRWVEHPALRRSRPGVHAPDRLVPAEAV